MICRSDTMWDGWYLADAHGRRRVEPYVRGSVGVSVSIAVRAVSITLFRENALSDSDLARMTRNELQNPFWRGRDLVRGEGWQRGRPPLFVEGRYDCEDSQGVRFAVTVENRAYDGELRDTEEVFRGVAVFDDGGVCPHHRWEEIVKYYPIPDPE